jgi:hypothetical protein
MSTISTRIEHQHTVSGTSSSRLDRNTLISHLSDSAPAPGGTIWERIDRSMLKVIADIFPAPTLGQVFFARFLERAASEKSIIPDVARDRVYICTKSIATLGQELNLSNDTTQKYVKLFTALGLLRKQKFMSQLAFIMSIGIYHPPQNLEANLDFLIVKSRPKLHDMAVDVKARCQVYGLISQDITTALQRLNTLLHTEKGDSRRTVEQRLAQAQQLTSRLLHQVLTSHLPKAHSQVDSLLPELSPQLLITKEDREQPEKADESTHSQNPGRRKTEEPPQNLPLLMPWVDAGQEEHTAESTQSDTSSRRSVGKTSLNLLRVTHQVDAEQLGQDTESTQKEDADRRRQGYIAANLPACAEKVDPDASISPSNVNVITLINNITLNVKLVAAFCCRALGEPLSKQQIYLKLFRECENDAQAITAALLFTLAHERDGTIRNPASVFVARCRSFHTQGIPDEAAFLVKQYGALTYSQLLDALRKSTSSAPSMQGASSHTSIPPSTTPSSLPPLPRWGTIPRLILVTHSRSGMSREEALRVIAHARGDRRTKMCRVDLEPLSDGTYAVLLDNTITAIPRQTYFYSLRDWEARTATIKDCFELFGGAIPERRRLLDDMMKRRSTR